MNVRKMRGALDHKQVRDILEAEHFAEKRGNRLNTTITIHPKLLAEYPGDIGGWLSAFLNKLRIWCGRAGFGYFCIWVRENYAGDRREHLHVLMYVPERQRKALEEAVGRWLPGDARAVRFGRPEIDRAKSGQLANKALTYLLKQMTSKAWFGLGKRVRREKRCRETHAPVAPVLGKRYGISRSLSKATRAALWAAPGCARTAARPTAIPSSDQAAA